LPCSLLEKWISTAIGASILLTDVHKVTLKSSGDEVLSDEFLLKSNDEKYETMIFHKK
jgi:hypothetical protein